MPLQIPQYQIVLNDTFTYSGRKLIWISLPTDQHSSTVVPQAPLGTSSQIHANNRFLKWLNNSETTTSLFISFLPALCIIISNTGSKSNNINEHCNQTQRNHDSPDNGFHPSLSTSTQTSLQLLCFFFIW